LHADRDSPGARPSARHREDPHGTWPAPPRRPAREPRRVMSEHISDDLPRLLTGEATRAETLAAAAHLRECPDCQQELVSAVVAHAALTSATRGAAHAVLGRDPQPGPLPDLSEVFATVRDEATSTRGSGKRRRALIAVAAAAVLATGVGVTIAET